MERKWKDSGVRIYSIDELSDCISLFGGVWDKSKERFINVSFIMGMPLRTIITKIATFSFHKPIEITEDSHEG